MRGVSWRRRRLIRGGAWIADIVGLTLAEIVLRQMRRDQDCEHAPPFVPKDAGCSGAGRVAFGWLQTPSDLGAVRA
jgi:hypothetical protein